MLLQTSSNDRSSTKAGRDAAGSISLAVFTMASRIGALASYPGVRSINPAEAQKRHLRHRPAGARNAPPVLTNVPGQRPSVYLFDQSKYPNEFSNGVIRYCTSNHRPSHAALVRLASADSEIDVIALVNHVYYAARARISTAPGGNNRYFMIRIVHE